MILFNRTKKNNHVIYTIFGMNISFKTSFNFVYILNGALFFLPRKLRLRISGIFSSEYKWKYSIDYKKYNYKEIFELFDSYNEFPKNILSIDDTINYIVNSNISIARIGDGEELYNNILEGNCKFPLLREKLIEIMSNGSNNNCLVCINNFNVNNHQVPTLYRQHFTYYWCKVVSSNIIKTLKFSKNNIYGDAYSLYFFYKENESEDETNRKKEIIKKIWNNRKVLFVINKNSKILKDTTCFNNIKEKEYLFIPDCDAFSEYDHIYEKITNNYDKDWLIYIEAGACATVLSYELSKVGYRALDMGGYYGRIYNTK